MRRALLIGAATLAVCSTLVLAQEAPEDLLPPGFNEPAPAPSARPTAPNPRGTAPAAPTIGAQPGAPRAGEIVQPLPQAGSDTSAAALPPMDIDLSKLPTLDKLESMSTDEIDELLGLKPKDDIPPAAQRSMEEVGILAASEGGLPVGSLAMQPATLVRAAIAGTKGPLVSRWGHILLRRALASRLAAPAGMSPVEFATLRVGLLNRMGEHAVARAVAQDVDTGNYSPALTNAAINAYVGTGDITGACPSVRLVDTGRDDPEWKMLSAICAAYAGEETRAQNDLRRALNRGEGARIDVLLAQRYAGAAGAGRRAVTIEWDGIDDMTPWRYALATSLGEPIPDSLASRLSPYYLTIQATAPTLAPIDRVRGADVAGAGGVLSSAAMVDLYSQIFAESGTDSDASNTAEKLREAYVEDKPADRLAAIRAIWGKDQPDYGRLVLTAYAAARMEPSADFASESGRLIASMLAAGLDRDAMRWSNAVESGSEGWALLALARPNGGVVSGGDVDSFVSNDGSSGQRKAKMLVAGLAGLGRLDQGDVSGLSNDLGLGLNSQTRWTRMIDRAAQVDNRVLVSLLAGLGMQGDNWDRMTARHLYHIVAGLRRVGLEAEARMIAAEAVARA